MFRGSSCTLYRLSTWCNADNFSPRLRFSNSGERPSKGRNIVLEGALYRGQDIAKNTNSTIKNNDMFLLLADNILCKTFNFIVRIRFSFRDLLLVHPPWLQNAMKSLFHVEAVYCVLYEKMALRWRADTQNGKTKCGWKGVLSTLEASNL